MQNHEQKPLKTKLAYQKEAGWFKTDECSLNDIEPYLQVETRIEDYPFASEIVKRTVVYDRNNLPLEDSSKRRQLLTEFMTVLKEGPGVMVIRGAFEPDVIDQTTELFNSIMEKERNIAGAAKGDQFGAKGANSRLWNALEKHAVEDPDSFVKYYENECMALVSQAWLGPSYQMTTQVNIVHPGGPAQQAHRDYHFGLMSNATCELYPEHAHQMSSMLTLQGAVAHCDMPLESGPTLFLPHTQRYSHGYLVHRSQEFQTFFKEHAVQVPLGKGDLVYFNPAILHGAGSNKTTDIQRMANLIQVSSAFGRAMENIDRKRISLAIYESLIKVSNTEPGWNRDKTANVVASASEGYPFPTNLDRDHPIPGEICPKSQAQIMHQAIEENWDYSKLEEALESKQLKSHSH